MHGLMRRLSHANEAATRRRLFRSAELGRAYAGPFLTVLLAFAILPAKALAAPSLAVSGPNLVDQNGKVVQLRGVNRSGTEYACSTGHNVFHDVDADGDADGYGIFDGPSYTGPNVSQPASILEAMKPWKINVVRVPVNESCWLGKAGYNPDYSGAAYRQAIIDWIDQIGAAEMYAIVDLHVAGANAAGANNEATTLMPMADADNAPTFWTQVSAALGSRSHVLFDAFNEPHFFELPNPAAEWTCWRDGCTFDPQPIGGPGGYDPTSYAMAGMQQLVNAIRSSGTSQPIMLGGVDYAGTVDQWLTYKPNDPKSALVASFHAYAAPIGQCITEACWESQLGTIHKAGYPVVIGETGQFDCQHDYIDRVMNWADDNGLISYLAWTWNETDGGAWTCGGGPSVLKNYDGTPTSRLGEGFKAHLIQRAKEEESQQPPAEPLTLALEAKAKQQAEKLRAFATCSANCDLSLSAKGKAGTKFTSRETNVALKAGERTRVAIRYSKKVRRWVTDETGKGQLKAFASAGGEIVKDSAKVKFKK